MDTNWCQDDILLSIDMIEPTAVLKDIKWPSFVEPQEAQKLNMLTILNNESLAHKEQFNKQFEQYFSKKNFKAIVSSSHKDRRQVQLSTNLVKDRMTTNKKVNTLLSCRPNSKVVKNNSKSVSKNRVRDNKSKDERQASQE